MAFPLSRLLPSYGIVPKMASRINLSGDIGHATEKCLSEDFGQYLQLPLIHDEVIAVQNAIHELV
jgi:hypothetical protein